MVASYRIPVCALLVACVLPAAAGARIRHAAKPQSRAAVEFFQQGAKLEQSFSESEAKGSSPKKATKADAVSLLKEQLVSGACSLIEDQLLKAAVSEVIKRLEPILELEDCVQFNEKLCKPSLHDQLSEVVSSAVWKGIFAATSKVNPAASLGIKQLLRLGGMKEKIETLLVDKMDEPLVIPLTDGLFELFEVSGQDTDKFSKDGEGIVKKAIGKASICNLLGKAKDQAEGEEEETEEEKGEEYTVRKVDAEEAQPPSSFSRGVANVSDDGASEPTENVTGDKEKKEKVQEDKEKTEKESTSATMEKKETSEKEKKEKNPTTKGTADVEKKEKMQKTEDTIIISEEDGISDTEKKEAVPSAASGLLVPCALSVAIFASFLS